MPWPIMYWKEGYKGFHSDCALNHVEFRTNHEPNMVHGVVDGEMHFQLVIIDEFVKSKFSPPPAGGD